MSVTLYAWVGEDELGSGVVGIKQAVVPAGTIPIVATRREKVDHEDIVRQLQAQANHYGKEIRLIACVEVETLLIIRPRKTP